MLTDQAILLINITCSLFLVIMFIVLVAATRMKGGAGWAAIILVTTTVPAYLTNMTRDLGMDNVMLFMYPAVFLNALCFPALWFFTRRQFDKSFRLTWSSLLYALPAIISLVSSIIYYVPLSPDEIKNEMAMMEAGSENLPAVINDIIVFGQFFIYNLLIFLYVRKRKRYLKDNFSDSDYANIRWTISFLIMFFVLFFIVIVAYIIAPRTDSWLIPILNTVGLAYLVYVVIRHSTTAYMDRLPATPAGTYSGKTTAAVQTMSRERMKEISERLTDYLLSSKTYTNPDYSLAMLSVESGIVSKNISRAINGYLNKSFFDLINEMRVDEAKKRLRQLDLNSHTVDSVAGECGFSSRSSFFAAFKKVEGKTPSQWLKMEKANQIKNEV